MGNITRFQDIAAWQQARGLTKAIYGLTSEGAWAKDFGLRDQIRRASVSIMSNIAEGFDRQSDAEFRRFLAIAKGSAAEVWSHLYVALDLSYISDERFRDTERAIDAVSRMIGSFMSYLRSGTRRGREAGAGPGDSPTR